ncbi:MAG TPA: antibiotic biosynthesis monooxygenase [Anaerolineales bacterium]|nr:antibiotic biosynthesis monooxygenase [Anaerolineales bacterium]
MIQVIWQYEVKEGARDRFELAYGPGGMWSELFSKAPGFRGTALLRDSGNPHRYLTIDSWDTEEQRKAVLAQRAEEISALESAFREWTERGAEIGVYRILSEAIVRPSIGAHRGKRDFRRRDPHGRR